jgi:hypothetical protein
VVLDGTWDDIRDEQIREFDSPLQVSVNVGEGQRVFPAGSIETDGDRTIIHCPRDPGFSYDADGGVLKDRYSPWLQYKGRATLSLPQRTIIATNGAGTRLQSTSALVINGRKHLPCTALERVE